MTFQNLIKVLSIAFLMAVIGHNAVAQSDRLGVRHDLGGDFTLSGHHAESVSLQDFRGKIVLLYFGYTTCPDICPALKPPQIADERVGS